MGLAWTSHGGSTLYIETLNQQRRRKKGKGDEAETGNGGIEFTGEEKKIICHKLLRNFDSRRSRSDEELLSLSMLRLR